MARFSLNLVASRGCPFRCNWCAKPIFGDSYQIRPAADVASEMRLLKDEYGAEHLWFADDIFGLNRHWLEELAQAVEAGGSVIPFKIQARADFARANPLKRVGASRLRGSVDGRRICPKRYWEAMGQADCGLKRLSAPV